MRILIDVHGTQQQLDLVGHEPQSTLGALLKHACGVHLQAGEQLFIDRVAVPQDTELRDLTLLEGSRVGLTATEPPQQIPDWNVSIIAGSESGQATAIPQHRKLIIGRSPHSDVVLPTASASWKQCTIELDGDGVRIADSGSTNGTYIDGDRITEDGAHLTSATTVVIGGTALAIRPQLIEPAAPAPGSLRNLTPNATAPFNRPPKLGKSAPADPIVPPAPKDVPEASKFNLIAILAPIVMAVVLVLVLSDIRFALFALLSPVMAIGLYFEQRRRRSKNLKEEELRFTRALEDLQRTLVQAAESEVGRLQDAIPDPSIMLRRPAIPSTQLWARRASEPDCLSLQLGVGDVPWQPELDMRGVVRLHERVKSVLAQGRLTAAPVVTDLSDAGVVGIAGDRAGALALARNLLLQSSVHLGPADLTVGVFCDQGRQGDWDWASWLPHTRQGTGDGTRWMSYRKKPSTTMLRSLLESLTQLPTPRLLTVIDSEVLTEGRDSPARDLLGTGRSDRPSGTATRERPTLVSGIVLAATVDQLPAACTTVIEVGPDAAGIVQHHDSTDRISDVILTGVSLADAEAGARALAHFEDPELVLPGASLPTITKLQEILGAEDITPELVLRLWEAQHDFVVPIGVGEDGLFSVDLVHDGPHGVVAGTTGSGKSEILKALLASLVSHLTPEQLNLILVDFKGGAAFAAFERLPHTIGTISNLDEQLADRAIRALQAEMQRRQRLFAEAGDGIENLPAYLATNPKQPLPRILFIVDEFKELVKEFPDVLASLISVAAIGRTLGIHMILATQQPAGVVSEAILTNSNLRIAARVQKAEDSSSVISDGSAATISRFHRGRAFIQRGQDDLELVQTAYVSAPVRASTSQQIEVRGLGTFGAAVEPTDTETAATQAQARADVTDLDTLMEAVVEATQKSGVAPPRRVWPEPLTERVPLDGYQHTPEQLCHGALAIPPVGGVLGEVVLAAIADDPDSQRQFAAGWNMGDGNLLLMGVPGSGTSTTIASLALSLSYSFSPNDLDILCLDMGSRSIAALERLPHTVAYAGSGRNAKEQQLRFLRFLRAELQRRREASHPGRKMMICIDGLAALRDDLQDHDGLQLLDGLYRAYADGPSVGMHFVVATTRAKAIPSAMDEVTTQRWVYRLADDYDYSALGIRGTQKPAAVPGRCVDANTKLQMHIATPEYGLETAVAEASVRWGDVAAKPPVIGEFPDRVDAGDVSKLINLDGEPYRLPVGLREDSLRPAFLDLYRGEHVLIAGPARSGKSSLLSGIAEVLKGSADRKRVSTWGIYDRRSPLRNLQLDRTAEDPDEIPALVAALRFESGPVFLLIDDAERFEDTDQSIANLLKSAPPELTVIAAGRNAELRAQFNHWTKAIRKSRCGVLLQPDPDYDPDLLGVRVPRKSHVTITLGRGYACVDGGATLIQAISPTTTDVAVERVH